MEIVHEAGHLRLSRREVTPDNNVIAMKCHPYHTITIYSRPYHLVVIHQVNALVSHCAPLDVGTNESVEI